MSTAPNNTEYSNIGVFSSEYMTKKAQTIGYQEVDILQYIQLCYGYKFNEGI